METDVLSSTPVPTDQASTLEVLYYGRLCSGCAQQLLCIRRDHPPSLKANILWHPFEVSNYLQTKESKYLAVKDCMICSMFDEWISRLGRQGEVGNFVIGMVRVVERHEPIENILLVWKGFSHSSPTKWWQAYLVPVDSNSLCLQTSSMHRFDHRIGSNTGSSQNLLLAKRWLINCLQNHEFCRKQNKKTRPPSRLLHIHPTTIRLSVSDDFPDELDYCTLSYCWGHTENLRLTKDTERDLILGVAIIALPRTYQDAIAVCQYLGFHYLWIDALCIRQDSKDDWNTESLFMKDIYANGILNIAATAATDSEGGCFRERDPAKFATTIISLPINGVMDSYYLQQARSWNNTVDTAPLLKRGWVLQERLLSARVLHFGSSQMAWECGEHNSAASEEYPAGVHISEASGALFNVKANMAGLNDSTATTMWTAMVESYSRMALTMSDDKLVAASGLAKYFMTKSPRLSEVDLPYLAGMWYIDMVHQLCWSRRHRGETSSTRPKFHRAPSWSWAAIDGEVAFNMSFAVKLVAELLSAHIIPAGADFTGAISSGKIVLQGLLQRISTQAQSSDFSYPCTLTAGSYQGIGKLWPDDPTEDILNSELHFLPLKMALGDERGIVFGLALRMTGFEGEFKRIGSVLFFGVATGDEVVVARVGQCAGYSCYGPTTSVYDVTVI